MEPLQTKPAPVRLGKARSQVVGTLRSDSYPIFIHARVLDEILEYSEEDLRREIGGFLLGGIYDDGRPYVEIQHFSPARATIGEAASMTFTHETWTTFAREQEEKYPDSQLVGWHHTHPGLGIFLSNYDRFIHQNFFSQEWQVALVVDPRDQELGFFQWKDGELVDCGFVVVPTKEMSATDSSA